MVTTTPKVFLDHSVSAQGWPPWSGEYILCALDKHAHSVRRYKKSDSKNNEFAGRLAKLGYSHFVNFLSNSLFLRYEIHSGVKNSDYF